jgi:intracellular multiplication protein IcmB
MHDLLVSLGYQFSDKTRVWDVVDWLFDQGQVDAASRAQRFAVPRLPDLVQAAQAKTIQDQFGGEDAAKTPGGEKLVQVFIRNITSAQTEYTLISGFTRYDIGNAKAMAIDLEEVVGSMTSEEGKRRSAIMFLFARRLGARNFFLRWEELKSIVPERYRDYQEQRVNKIGESLKFLEYDEKHYTTGIESVDRQLAVDLRVGRKYKTVTMMFSQMLADFPRATVDNCYTYLIMGKGSAASARELQETFGLSDSEIGAIESKCTRPGVLFGLFKTKLGDTSQVLQLTAGPFCQWAFTSGKDDGMLREELIQRVGDVEALRMLAKVFPEGSAMKALELYRQRRDVGDRDTRSEAQIFADKVRAAIQRGDTRVL